MTKKYISAFFLLLTFAFNSHAAEPSPTLLTYWRSDCPPCRAELGTIRTIAQTHPQLRVNIMMLGASSDRPALSATASNLHVMHTETIPASYGNKRSILPFSAMLHSDGTLCKTHTGMLGTDRVDEWGKSC